jgi:very-short-patch-repair endonuclease
MLWFEFLRDCPTKFTRQKPLGHYIADFYCASQLLAIELDGDSHFTDSAESYDVRRTADLASRGITVLRFTNLEVMQQFEGCVSAFAMRWESKNRKPPVRLRLTTPLSGGQELAQFGFQHLAVVIFGKSFDKSIFARALEAGDVIQAEAIELL